MAHDSLFDSPPVPAGAFLKHLRAAGFDVYTGVPCSLVSGLIRELDTQSDVPYYAETREDAAIGLACGSYLAGKRPVVIMQNSGLGVSINALTSMTLMYRTPCLLLITWRGCPEAAKPDAPEHIIMGEVCARLLETIGVPYRIPTPESLAGDVEWAAGVMQREHLPAALLLRSGVTE